MRPAGHSTRPSTCSSPHASGSLHRPSVTGSSSQDRGLTGRRRGLCVLEHDAHPHATTTPSPACPRFVPLSPTGRARPHQGPHARHQPPHLPAVRLPALARRPRRPPSRRPRDRPPARRSGRVGTSRVRHRRAAARPLPVFRAIRGRGRLADGHLTGAAIHKTLRRNLTQRRLPRRGRRHLRGHSARAGFVTQALLNGATAHAIMRQTGPRR